MFRTNGKAASAVVQPWLVTTLIVGISAYAIGTSSPPAPQGQAKLQPPTGSIGGTMKTLDEIEPRTPINERYVSSKPGIAFAITQPGSYFLPNDFSVFSGDVAISIEAAPVTIDLMGYTIDGSHSSGDLIMVSSLADRVVIKNGSLCRSGGRGVNSQADTLVIEDFEIIDTNMNAMALDSGRAVTLRNVTISDTATGIALYGPGTVRAEHVEVTHATSVGISVSDSTRLTLTDSLVTNTGNDAIRAGRKAFIDRVRISAAGGHGVVLGDDSTLVNSQIDSFTGDGVVVGSRSVVEGNRMYAYSGNAGVLAAGVRTTGTDAIVKSNVVSGGGPAFYGFRFEGDRNLLSCNRNYDNAGYSLTSNNMVGNILNSVSSFNANQDPDANFDQ